MFGDRHRLRRIAVQLLVAWLFALAASVVNACLLEPGSRYGDAVASAMNDRHAAAAAGHHRDTEAAGAQGHRQSHSGKTPCAKFCDDPSTGAQAIKQQVDPFHTALLVPLPVCAAPVDPTPAEVGAYAADHALWRPAIPVQITFLRLNL